MSYLKDWSSTLSLGKTSWPSFVRVCVCTRSFSTASEYLATQIQTVTAVTNAILTFALLSLFYRPHNAATMTIF